MFQPRFSLLISSLLSALVLLAMPAFATAFATEELDLVGEYICKGKNPDGGEYRGAVTITKKGDSLSVKWKYEGTEYEGIALVAERTLSVCWVQKRDRAVAVGIGTYTMRMDGKTMDGRWTTFGGDGTVRVESLTRVEAEEEDL